MKIALKWLVVVVFAFQATGASWFVHLASCSKPAAEELCCPCGGGCRHSIEVAWPQQACGDEHPARPSEPGPCHHDPAKCPTCQVLLTLAATTTVPPALPAIAQATFNQPIPTDHPLADAFPAILDARGPPAHTL
jgi:hypothetical protein